MTKASSPMKKSKSSVPRFAARLPAPPLKNEGFDAGAGLPEPDPPVGPPTAPFVAIAVGNTNEGASLPAKPMYEALGTCSAIDREGLDT